MRFSEYPTYLKDLWASHEAFRRLGFSSDDIYVLVGRDGIDPLHRWTLFSLLKAQKKEFCITISYHVQKKKAVESVVRKEWPPFVARINAREFDNEELHTHFHEWLGRNGGAMSFTAAVMNKGFYLPKRFN